MLWMGVQVAMLGCCHYCKVGEPISPIRCILFDGFGAQYNLVEWLSGRGGIDIALNILRQIAW